MAQIEITESIFYRRAMEDCFLANSQDIMRLLIVTINRFGCD